MAQIKLLLANIYLGIELASTTIAKSTHLGIMKFALYLVAFVRSVEHLTIVLQDLIICLIALMDLIGIALFVLVTARLSVHKLLVIASATYPDVMCILS